MSQSRHNLKHKKSSQLNKQNELFQLQQHKQNSIKMHTRCLCSKKKSFLPDIDNYPAHRCNKQVRLDKIY